MSEKKDEMDPREMVEGAIVGLWKVASKTNDHDVQIRAYTEIVKAASTLEYMKSRRPVYDGMYGVPVGTYTGDYNAPGGAPLVTSRTMED